jgi:hypothetical protein
LQYMFWIGGKKCPVWEVRSWFGHPVSFSDF